MTVNRRDHYLGPYDSPESYNEYARLIAEWRQGLLGEAVRTTRPNESVRIAELTLSYWTHCQTYYRHADGSNGRLAVVRSALQAVNACFPNEKTNDFGPLKLQTVRQTLIDRDLSRTYITGLVAVIVAMFRRAVAQEMVDVRVHQALSAVVLRHVDWRIRATRLPRPVRRQALGHAGSGQWLRRRPQTAAGYRRQ